MCNKTPCKVAQLDLYQDDNYINIYSNENIQDLVTENGIYDESCLVTFEFCPHCGNKNNEVGKINFVQ